MVAKKQICFLCAGHGKLEINKKSRIVREGNIKYCPMCEGKGYLKVDRKKKR